MKVLCFFAIFAVSFLQNVRVQADQELFLDKQQASRFLGRREKRANNGILEELKQGNWERECVEEQCSYEEVREVFENDKEAKQMFNYLTQQCETNKPCNATGTESCKNLYSSFSCNCKPGFSGDRCADDIDECSPESPCVHGGCVNTFGSFHCNCDAGYSGNLCDQDVDECAFGYCPEGSECQNGLNSFTCVCPDTGCHAKSDVVVVQVQQQVEDP